MAQGTLLDSLDHRAPSRRRAATVLLVIASAILIAGAPSAHAQVWSLNLHPTPGGRIDTVVEAPSLHEYEIRPLGLYHLYTFRWIDWDVVTQSSCSSSATTNCVINRPDNYASINVPVENDTVGDLVQIPVVKPSSRVTFTAVPDPGYYFHGWGSAFCADEWPSLAGGGQIMSCRPEFPIDADLFPVFSQCPPGASCITVQASPNSIGTVSLRQGTTLTGPAVYTCATLCTFQVPPGSDWILSGASALGAVLSDWTGCDTTPANGACLVHVTGEKRIGSRFKYPLVVTNSSPFVYLWVDQERKYLGTCDSTSSPCTYLLDPGAQVGLTRRDNPPALASYRYTKSWEGCTPRVYPGGTAEITNFCDVTMTGPQAVRSIYLDEWHFTVARPLHGRIVSNPAGIDCSPASNLCDAWFPVYSTPTFTATPDPGYSFFGWNDGRIGIPGGDCASAGSSPVCSVYLNHQPVYTGASFYPQVTVQVGTGGGVQMSVGSASPYDTGVDCPAVAPNLCRAVAPGSSVTLTSTAFSRFTFSGWGGACTGTGPCTPLINDPTSITASFAGTHQLILSTGAQGIVGLSSVPFRVACHLGCDTSVVGVGSDVEYSTGTVVTLTAVSGAAPGYPDWVFSGWSGACTGKSRICTLNIGSELVDPDGYTRVSANFTQGAQTQVIVSGQGRVTSDLPGVDCTGSCFQYMAAGTLTTLTATPDPGWVFAGWSAAGCGGTGTCTPTIHYDPPYGTGNTPITATFAPANVDLASLTLSRGTLAPVFSSSTLSYTATVGYGVPTLSITPTVSDGTSTVQVRSNGGIYQTVASGSASAGLPLNVGANTVDVTVTASDLVTTRTYTFTVTRKAFGPGDVEASFMPFTNTNILGMAAQPDGRMVVSNWAFAGTAFLQGLARVNTDDSVDLGFTPTTNNGTENVNLQADGKVVMGGFFASVNSIPRRNIARVNADGTIDPDFNPDLNGAVRCALIQPDGKLVIMGQFTTVGGVPQNRIARLLSDGSLDPGFSANVGDFPQACAVQRDGKILIGNGFSSVNGVPRNRIARLNADGSLDTGFDPGLGSSISIIDSFIEQPDLKILVAGFFTSIGGVPRRNLARLNPDGSVDLSFNPDPDFPVLSLALQADGRIILGGGFTSVGGVSRNRAARVNADGTLDPDFDPDVASGVRAVALQADGRVLISGDFSAINGIARPRFARLANDPATSSLSVPGLNRIEWLRGGSSPEAVYVTFELSTDGTTWSSLGFGTRISGGWEVTGLSLPASGLIRARARVTSGNQNASSGLVQATRAYGGFEAPEVSVSAGGIDIANGDATPSVVDQTHFGGALAPGGSVAHTFTIANSGVTNLTLGSVSVVGAAPGDFHVTAQPAAAVPAGGSTTFEVTFAPTASGTRSAALSFATNDVDENPFNFAIQGSGVPVTVVCPTITLPSSLPNGVIGAAYAGRFTAGGGTGPYSYSLSSGSLPGGLALSGDGFSGAPSATGTFVFGITATDTAAPSCTGSATYTVLIGSAVAQGDLVIREFRLRGPVGPASATDEYVALHNRTNTSITIAAPDGSAGFTVADSNGVPVFTIPNGLVIPARGHFLGANTSGGPNVLGVTPDASWTRDLADGLGLGLFNTSTPANFTVATAIDAVGSNVSSPPYREGTGLDSLTTPGEYAWVRKGLGNSVQDTNVNQADFVLVSTNGAVYDTVQSVLGAPSPTGSGTADIYERLAVSLIEPNANVNMPPNRSRVLAGGDRLEFRRRVTNNTGAPITMLRLRFVELTTFQSPGYATGSQADLRPGSSVTVGPMITSFGAVTPVGLTLLTPPGQPLGGGLNSILRIPGGLASGASIDLNIALYVFRVGGYRFFATIEGR
ncbi:MAG: choice-of-anchor D domain-containing protein [Vicinamibacteria bacterium]|nr:choice-of-anchor D domain-containing protein [Vicinamibacteria bacterium]